MAQLVPSLTPKKRVLLKEFGFIQACLGPMTGKDVTNTSCLPDKLSCDTRDWKSFPTFSTTTPARK